MLWLNLSTGDVVEAPKRPSAAWVVVISASIDGQMVESTLEGLERAITSSLNYTTRTNDIEMDGKTQLNVFANEKDWLRLIEESKFPYLKGKIADDGTLEITYDNEAQVKAVKEANPEAVVKQVKVKERVKVKKAIPIHKAKAEKVKEKAKAKERANPIPMVKAKEKAKVKVNPMVKVMARVVMLTKKAKIVPNPFPINSKKR